MKKTLKLTLTLALAVVLCFSQQQLQAQTQENQEVKPLISPIKIADNVQLKIGGFIRAEYLFDSRQPVAAVNDLVGFFPANKSLDANGKDVTDVSRSSISSQGTRFNTAFTGPDVLKAKSTAFFEIDFTGAASPVLNIRFRHAYLKFIWDKAELLFGKTWNPMGETPAPGVAGLAGAAPFRPFGRSEQLRLVLKPAPAFHIWLAGVYKTEHSYGLDGGLAGGENPVVVQSDIKNGTLPELHLQLRYVSANFSAGFVSSYKNIRPSTSITTGTGENRRTYLAENTLSSYAVGGFIDYKNGGFNVKAGTTVGQNLGEYFMVGGYAVKDVNANGVPTYTPLAISAHWAFLSYTSKQWTPALFFGYADNQGFGSKLTADSRPIASGPIGGVAFNVAHAYRLAPSLKYAAGRIAIHAELEYNVAAYVKDASFNDKGKPTKSDSVGGVRFLLATSFFF